MTIITCSCGTKTSYTVDDIIDGYGICVKCQSINNVNTNQKISDEEWLDLDVESRSKIKRLLEIFDASKRNEEIHKIKDRALEYFELFQNDFLNSPVELIMSKLITYFYTHKEEMSKSYEHTFMMTIGALLFLESIRKKMNDEDRTD
jgi:hypothetical protein